MRAVHRPDAARSLSFNWLRSEDHLYFEDGIPPEFYTPSGKIEFYSLQLKEAGFDGPLLIILSHGGVAPVSEAVRVAAATVLSGPAGGLAGGRLAALDLALGPERLGRHPQADAQRLELSGQTDGEARRHLGAARTDAGSESFVARSRLVLAARAAGVQPLVHEVGDVGAAQVDGGRVAGRAAAGDDDLGGGLAHGASWRFGQHDRTGANLA